MDWESKLEEFFKEGHWILSPGKETEPEYGCYLWENFAEAVSFYRSNTDELYGYTVVDVDGDLYILEGVQLVNRFAYLFSTIPVPIEDAVLYYTDEGEYNEELR